MTTRHYCAVCHTTWAGETCAVCGWCEDMDVSDHAAKTIRTRSACVTNLLMEWREIVRVIREKYPQGSAGADIMRNRAYDIEVCAETLETRIADTLAAWLVPQQEEGAALNEMRKSDAQVRATLQAMKLPLLGATWQATPNGGDGAFHTHLDTCRHCAAHPFALCPEGHRLLTVQTTATPAIR